MTITPIYSRDFSLGMEYAHDISDKEEQTLWLVCEWYIGLIWVIVGNVYNVGMYAWNFKSSFHMDVTNYNLYGC